MEEKKNNNGLIVLIVVLVILILGLGGFIGYTVLNGNLTFNNKTDSQNNTNNETNNNQTDNKEELKKEKLISETDLVEYLSYVPFTEVYEKDAYSGSVINYNNIDKKVILENVYHKIPYYYRVTLDKFVENPLSPSGKTNAGIDIEDFDNQTKEMYNNVIDNINEFEIDGGLIIKQDGYYTGEAEQDYDDYYRVYIIKDYEIDNDDLIIYEQGGFCIDVVPGIEIYNLYPRELIYQIDRDGENYITQDNMFIGNGAKATQYAKDYILNNIDKFKTFKHTFKLNKDTNRYYWYQTELSE